MSEQARSSRYIQDMFFSPVFALVYTYTYEKNVLYHFLATIFKPERDIRSSVLAGVLIEWRVSR